MLIRKEMQDIKVILENELEDLRWKLDMKYVDQRTKDDYNFINCLYDSLINGDKSDFDAEEEYKKREEENRLISIIIRALEYYHERH